MDKTKLINNLKLLIFIAVLFIIGLIFVFAMPGYLVLGCAFIFAAMVIAVYRLLRLLKITKPKLSRVINKVFTYCLLLFLMALAITEGAIISDAHSDENVQGKYVIILGAGVNGTKPSWSLKTRLEAGLEYLEANPDTICIVTGGQGGGEMISEAECMRVWLEENGVNPDRIIKEEQAENTKENISNSLAIIESSGGTVENGVIIVTNEYHLLRAKLIASRLGADTYGLAASTGLPLLTVNYFLREALSLWKLLIFG